MDPQDNVRRRLAIVFTLLLLVAVGGIAWWLLHGPTKDSFIEEADAICRAGRDEALSFDEPVDLESSGRFVDQNISLLERQLRDIRELEIPEEDRAVLDEWFATYERVAGELRDSVRAAETGNQKRFDAAFERASTVSVKLDRVARDYGFEVCGITPPGAGGE